MSTQPVGSIAWTDLTVANAEQIRDFYSAVVGWQATPHDMGAYADYDMKLPGGDTPITGICHARGMNANIPAQWMIYITVADLDQAVAKCQALGGRIVDGPKSQGGTQRSCVIEDPAGAVVTLFAG
jgi:uncharacterized protein